MKLSLFVQLVSMLMKELKPARFAVPPKANLRQMNAVPSRIMIATSVLD